MKQEIAALNLQGSSIEIPGEVLELALKSGKVAFTWRLIRSWLSPTPVEALPSAHDGAVLELPLSMVAPIFLAQKQNSSRRKQVVVDENIPDLFSGKDRAPSPSSIVNPPAPFGRSDGETETLADTPQRPPKPNDIVGRAAALAGVDGCLVALHDGLLVAGQVPPPWNSDTLAAFVPQIFGRVNQTMRELRLGELNHLSFSVGSVPWHIVRLGGTYFAAFGRTGTTLPLTELGALAAELESQS